MEAGAHAFAQNDEVRPEPESAVIENLRPPKTSLDFVNAHEGSGLVATFAGELEVSSLEGDGFAIHQDRFGPKTGHAGAVFAKGSGQRVFVVWLDADYFAAVDQAGPHTADELRQHVTPMVVPLQSDHNGNDIGSMLTFENPQLDFQGGRASN